MANSASPTRLQAINAVKAWLKANGVKTFRVGWFDPGSDGAGKCALPLAAFILEPARFDPSGSGSYREDQELRVILWYPSDGSAWTSDTYGGWTKVWTMHDDLLAGPKSIGQFFPQYGSAQFVAEIESWEEYWWYMNKGTPLGVEMTLRLHVRIGPDSIA